jgi:hypothetical protein
MHINTKTQTFLLPFPAGVTAFCTQSIWPETKLVRSHRRTIERVPFGYLIIEADPDPTHRSPAPQDFDDFTVRWALRKANFAVVWSGDVPYNGTHFTERLQAHARRGSIVTIALVREDQHDVWSHHAFQWCPRATEIFRIRPRPEWMTREEAARTHLVLPRPERSVS